MRKLLALAAVVAIATPAFAGLGVDTRYDYISGQSNSQLSSQTQYGSGFAFSRMFITGDGKLGEGVSFKAALNPLSFAAGTQTVSDGTNANSTKTGAGAPAGTFINPSQTKALVAGSYPQTGPNDFVQWAEGDAKITDMVTVNVGKLADIGLGGFEGQENPGDEYFLAMGNLSTLYVLGAQVQYQISDTQKVGVPFFNNTTATDSVRMGAGVWYAGTFGNVGLRVSYHTLPGNAMSAAGFGATSVAKGAIATTPLTVGLSYKMDDWKFTLDYDSITVTNASLLGNNQVVTSAVVTARYNMGNWTPWVKLESTSRQGFQTAATATSDASDSVMNWSLAAEYKKNATDPFRYELAYLSSATSYAGNSNYTGQTNASVTDSAMYAGIRYVGDFLK